MNQLKSSQFYNNNQYSLLIGFYSKHIREFPDDSHLKVNPERWNLIKNQEKHVE
jgi:hypothetical protein